MILLIKNGIPHWVEGGLALPIMMGAQEISPELRALLAGTGEEEEAGLAALVGQSLLDLNTNFFGIVRTRTDRRTGQVVYWLSDPNTGRAQDLRTGATLVDPNTRVVTNISASTTGSAADSTVTSGGKLSEADLRRLFGEEDDGGGGRAPPAFSSTQAAQAQAEAFRREQDKLLADAKVASDLADREFAEEQNRLAEEAALKRGRLSTLTDLIQSFVASQAQARDTLANLQPAPFRFAAVSGGIAPFGVTPQQGFTEQLQQFASAPAPTADPNASLPSIESAIQGLTGANVPLSPQTFGMAGGGTVPTPFNVMSARLVGEQGPEVMVTGPQGVTILPLGKGAQDGGFFPFEPIKFDRETLLPALGTSGIFGSLGFSGIPNTTRLPSGSLSFSNLGGFSGRGGDFLQRLGVRPSLIGQAGGSGGIFFRTADDVLQRIESPQAFTDFGFQSADVTALSPQTIQQMGLTFGNTFQGQPPVPTERASAFTPFTVPIVEPTTGTVLPAPFQIASQLNKLRLTDPFIFNLLLSAYESAGVPGVDVLATVQASLPFGQERTLTGLR